MFSRLFPVGSLRRLVALNTTSQLVGRVVNTLAMTLVSLFIARKFGAYGYGDFVKITTYIGFFYLFADFGFNAQFIQQKQASWQRLFGLRLIVGLFLIGVAALLLTLFPLSVGQGYTTIVRNGIYLLLPAILTQATITTTNAYFQKNLRYDLAARAQNIGSFVMIFFVILLAFTSRLDGAIIGVVALIIGSAATAMSALASVSTLGNRITPLFHWNTIRDDIRQTFPLGMTLVFNLVYFHSDSVILTLTRSTQEVGVYGLAYKLFELPLVLPIFYINAIYPLLIRAPSNRATFWKSFWLLIALSIVVSATFWIFAPLLSFVRADFYQSVLPLRVLLLGLPVFFVSALLMWLLIAQNKLWQLFVIHGFAMIVNIVLNALLIPIHGYMAAAWITIGCETITLLLSGIVLIRK